MSNNKMREALEAVYECAKDGVLTIRESAFEKVVAALTEPLRNCDVGTAKEQEERHDKFCTLSIANCHGVSTNDCIHCFSHWLQMPYESEVKK
jgi:hypothetical protein